jgi:virginiamycin B lyase
MPVPSRTDIGRDGRDWICLRSNGPRRRVLLGLLTVALAALAMPVSAAAIDEFPVLSGTNPGSITRGPDGALWFTLEGGDGAIGRMTTGGVHTNTFPLPPCSGSSCSSSVPPVDQIVTGPNGNLWFTMTRSNAIGQMNTAGAMAIHPIDTPDSQPEGLTVGPDGRLWFTEANFNGIGAIRVDGTDEDWILPTSGSGPSDITAGPDGALWFTETLTNKVGRITTTGVVTNEFDVPTAFSEPSGITNTGAGLWFTESAVDQIAQISTGGVITEYPGAGDQPSAIAVANPPGDGALWYTESGAGSNAIGRITTGGIVTNHFPVPTPGSEPSDITQGPDGNLWFTEFLANKIGRVVTAPPVVLPPPPPVVSLTPPKAKRKCKVPKLRGLTIKKAKKKLKKARCKYKIRGKGRVVSTKPKAGKRTSKTVKVKASRKAR